MADFSNIVKSTGVALEAEAFKQFGAAVSNAAGGVLGSIFGTPPSAATSDAQLAIQNNREPGVWDPTPYASRIASGAGNYDPKTKFLFKVKFEFFPEPAQMAASLGVDVSDLSRDLTFVIKQIDLPKIDFEYEEVNMYNFRTKVLRQIKNRELTMTFYDDTGNHSLSFANVYMMLFKPISRAVQMPSMHHEDHGFAFNPDYVGLDTAYRGYLPGNRKDILSKMTVEQFYLDRSNPNPIQAVRLNSYVFTNPRITSFDIDDQDYETGGEPNTITLTFDFDALNIAVGKAGTEKVTPSLAGSDILDGLDEVAAAINRIPNSPAGKTRNPFIDIIARQGQRAAQNAVAGVLNKTFGTVAGGALGPAISSVAGALGAAAHKTLSGTAASLPLSTVPPATPFVRDNSASASSVANLSRQTSSNPSGGT